MDFKKINTKIDRGESAIDFRSLERSTSPDYERAINQIKNSVSSSGYLILKNGPISLERQRKVFSLYRNFFHSDDQIKACCDMAKTVSNRGWGRIGSEQVNPEFEHDYKEMFDVGTSLPPGHKFSDEAYYAPNIWPSSIPGFKKSVISFYDDCIIIGEKILESVTTALKLPVGHFSNQFDLPMALLRCNFYPVLNNSGKIRTYGTAPHTDYGCITILFTGGASGLQMQMMDGNWVEVCPPENQLIVNFGDMLERWSDRKVRATPHKVEEIYEERFSIAFFFNPRYDTNIAPQNEKNIEFAGDYLTMKYDTTYVHKQPL